MTFFIGTICPCDVGERLLHDISRNIFFLNNAFLKKNRTEERKTNIILSIAVVTVINASMTRRLNGDNMPLMTPGVTSHEQCCAYDDVVIAIKVLPRSLRIYVCTLEKNN